MEKSRKDKLWKFEATFEHTPYVINKLKQWSELNHIPISYIDIDKYDSSNFVVFSINLEGYTINGTTTTVNKAIYWYGFLLNNNQTLQVVNMNTATYYNFNRNGA